MIGVNVSYTGRRQQQHYCVSNGEEACIANRYYYVCIRHVDVVSVRRTSSCGVELARPDGLLTVNHQSMKCRRNDDITVEYDTRRYIIFM